MATQVTRVVVHEAILERGVRDIEFAAVDEVFEQLAVVHNFVVTAELWVLVSERVETVWTLGHNLLHTHRVQCLDVLHRQHLEDVFVAGTASWVTGAHF